MSITQQNPDSTERGESRLEKDTDEHCLECGIGLPFTAVQADYERCPECILEVTKDELLVAFGSLNSVEAAPTWKTEDDGPTFEVGVKGADDEYEHIIVTAPTPDDAYDKAVEKARSSIHYDLEGPLHAYQAYEIGEGMTHTP